MAPARYSPSKHGRDDGNAREQIGSELAPQKFPKQLVNQRNAAQRERDEERNLVTARIAVDSETQDEMHGDPGDRDHGNDRGATLPNAFAGGRGFGRGRHGFFCSGVFGFG